MEVIKGKKCKKKPSCKEGVRGSNCWPTGKPVWPESKAGGNI